MAKKTNTWLKDFKSVYKASDSFLDCMNKALQKEYSEITGRDFDVLYLFAERPSDLVYLPSEHAAVLKASIEIVKRTYWGDCLIGWRHRAFDRVVRPEEEIKEEDVEFRWIELTLPIFPEEAPTIPSLGERLGLSLNYELINNEGASVDLTFIVEGSQAVTIPDRLGTIINEWNRLAAEDETKQKGFIHNLLLESIEKDIAIFTIDTGSSGYDGLKLILAELNDPVWGVRKVTID
jgi:hypothetical protein